jgi:hypothetical protein
MTEQQTEALSLKAAYEFGGTHGLEREVREIREMIIEWDLSYTSSLYLIFVSLSKKQVKSTGIRPATQSRTLLGSMTYSFPRGIN